MKKRRLKPQIFGISIRAWMRYLCYAALLILFIIFTIVLCVQKNALPDQLEGKRWSADNDAAQVTAFFAEKADVNADNIAEWRYNTEKALQEKSITRKNDNARLYADSYAAMGSIAMSTDYGSVNVTAWGVGGDFFLFHPVKLLDGGYFSESDIMQDAVVIDRETAWQLYGSSDIVGKKVTIGGIEHRIVGVYEKEDGKLYQEAGNNENLCFVSYTTMQAYGESSSILFYEAVLPNVVKGFALQILKDSCTMNEKQIRYVDNSARFSYESLLDVLKMRRQRMMKLDTIYYPVWENVARSVEYKAAVAALWQWVCATILVMAIIGEGIYFVCKHKLTKEKVTAWVDQWNDFVRKKREQKHRKEGENNEEI